MAQIRRSGLGSARRGFLVLAGSLAGSASLALPHRAAAQAAVTTTHGIAMHGAPALPADFAHLPYAESATRRKAGG